MCHGCWCSGDTSSDTDTETLALLGPDKHWFFFWEIRETVSYYKQNKHELMVLNVCEGWLNFCSRRVVFATDCGWSYPCQMLVTARPGDADHDADTQCHCYWVSPPSTVWQRIEAAVIWVIYLSIPQIIFHFQSRHFATRCWGLRQKVQGLK